LRLRTIFIKISTVISPGSLGMNTIPMSINISVSLSLLEHQHHLLEYPHHLSVTNNIISTSLSTMSRGMSISLREN
jgi:hypothetical protein